MLQEPERASEGLGGTYFFKDESGSKVAIVKPCDEEPLAPNNPKVPIITASQLLFCAQEGGFPLGFIAVWFFNHASLTTK